jgi:hypothetical protein
MTVRELIERLQTQDPELRVFTKGYEGGYNDVEFNGKIVEVVPDYNKEWYYGKHQPVDQVHKETLKTCDKIKGIVL